MQQMQRQSVRDFILSNAEVFRHREERGDNNRDSVDSGLVDLVESHYNIELKDDSALDVEKVNLEEFVSYVVGKLKTAALRQIDGKKIFDNFVFSGRTKRLTSPYELNIDLTFRCNLRCIFCYASSVKKNEQTDEMSIDEIFNIIDEFKSLNGAFVLFGGGEPFLREDFLEILRYTKSKGLWTYIISNGSLITEEVAYEYAKYYNPMFDKIQVSLDGSKPEVNDRQRGVKGAFEKTVSGIKNLTALGIRPIVNTVITKLNYEDIPNILNLAIELDASTYRCLKLHKIGRGAQLKLYDKIGLDQFQYEELYDFLNRKRDELLGIIGIASDNACVFPMATKALRDQFEKRPGEEPASYSCAAGTTKLAIAPNGGIVPCSYFYDFPEFHIGSLRENTLQEIWEDDERWQAFREPLKVEGKCRHCDYLYACKTGCRIMAYVGCGSIGGPDNGCTYDPLTDSVNL